MTASQPMFASPASGPNTSALSDSLPRLAEPSSYFVRRLAFGMLVGATSLALAAWLASIVASDGFGLVEVLLLALFTLYVPSLAIGFWNAALGFALLNRPRIAYAPVSAAAGADGPIPARTVIAMVLRNEPPARAFAQLNVLAASLARTGHLDCFDFFLLSDSNRAEVIAAEEAAFKEFRAAGGSTIRRFYRRLADHVGFKSGNVHDFCENEGRTYDLLVLLDSDSLMTGAAVLRLVRQMLAKPSLGILQTFSLGLPSRSLFSRIFLFGHRHGMRCTMTGAAWWQGDCGHYWGHNCIIRMAPFAGHCRLPYLPGGPFAGRRIANCASHDQIEAALMRRAGYEVRFLPEEGGSYEDNPPAFPEYIRRYRRWSLGSLQNLKLLDIPGLVPMSRFHLCLLADRYGGAAGLVVFALLAAWAAAAWPSGQSFPLVSAGALYCVWLLLYFSPKLFGVTDALLRSREHFGGAARLLAGCLVEIVFTFFLAPVSMFAAAAALLRLLFHRTDKWDGQQRDSYRLPWAAAFAEFWPPTLFGFALLAFLAVSAPHALPWFLPFVAGLLLAVPFAVITASPIVGGWAASRKLCATPEEIESPEEVGAIRPDLARAH
jgi:membrane glycosyltransferase